MYNINGFKFDKAPIILKQKFNAAPMPIEKTEIMSIYFDDILRLFEEQSKWFKNKENVKNEKGLDYIS